MCCDRNRPAAKTVLAYWRKLHSPTAEAELHVGKRLLERRDGTVLLFLATFHSQPDNVNAQARPLSTRFDQITTLTDGVRSTRIRSSSSCEKQTAGKALDYMFRCCSRQRVMFCIYLKCVPGLCPVALQNHLPAGLHNVAIGYTQTAHIASWVSAPHRPVHLFGHVQRGV